MKTTSSASRLACARLVRRHHDRRSAPVDVADDLLDCARGGPGRDSPWARPGTALRARAAQARASAKRCCSPTDSTRAGRFATPNNPTSPNARTHADPPRYRARRSSRAHSGHWPRPSGATARAVETPLPAPAGGAAAVPGHGSVRRRQQPVQDAQQRALAGAVRAENERALPASIVMSTPERITASPRT